MRKEPKEYSGRWVQRVPKDLHKKLSIEAQKQGVSLNMLVATMLAEHMGLAKRVERLKTGIEAMQTTARITSKF